NSEMTTRLPQDSSETCSREKERTSRALATPADGLKRMPRSPMAMRAKARVYAAAFRRGSIGGKLHRFPGLRNGKVALEKRRNQPDRDWGRSPKISVDTERSFGLAFQAVVVLGCPTEGVA